MIMSRNITGAMLAVACFTLFCVGFTPAVLAQGCSIAKTSGKWGFTANGTVVGIGPRISVGILSLDEVGNVLSGKATQSLNGAVGGEVFSGRYSVNPDCTGKMTVNIFDTSGNKLFTGTLDLVVDEDANELRGIYTSVVTPNGTALATVIAVEGKRINEP